MGKRILASDIQITGDLRVDGEITIGGVTSTIMQSQAATELTIASGAITPTQQHHIVDTEGDAASDDLTTISTAVGFLLLSLANAARVVTIKHGTSANQIRTADGNDLVMTDNGLVLLHRATTSDAWQLLAGGGGSATVTAADVSVAATPANYTPDDATVEGHLAGIDDALAGGGGGGTPITDNFLVDHTVSSAATTIDLSGFTLAKGKKYSMAVHIVSSPATASTINLYANGNTNGANYKTQRTYSTSTTVATQKFSDSRIGGVRPDSEGDPQYSTIYVDIAVNYAGQVTFDATCVYCGTAMHQEKCGVVGTGFTVTSITSLRLQGDDDFSVGTIVRLWECRNVSGTGEEANASVAIVTGPYHALTSGAKRTVQLSAEYDDPDGIVTVTSNQMQLAAGTYELTADTQIYPSSGGSSVSIELYFYDTTNSAELGYRSLYANSNNGCPGGATLHSKRFTLAGAANIEFQCYPGANCEVAANYDPGSRGTYAATLIKIKKVA